MWRAVVGLVSEHLYRSPVGIAVGAAERDTLAAATLVALRLLRWRESRRMNGAGSAKHTTAFVQRLLRQIGGAGEGEAAWDKKELGHGSPLLIVQNLQDLEQWEEGRDFVDNLLMPYIVRRRYATSDALRLHCYTCRIHRSLDLCRVWFPHHRIYSHFVLKKTCSPAEHCSTQSCSGMDSLTLTSTVFIVAYSTQLGRDGRSACVADTLVSARPCPHFR